MGKEKKMEKEACNDGHQCAFHLSGVNEKIFLEGHQCAFHLSGVNKKIFLEGKLLNTLRVS